MLAVAQVPQLPARQPESMRMPLASANSSNDPAPGVHTSFLPERVNVRSNPGASAPAAAGAGATFFTEAGPKASKCTRSDGTPQASRSRVSVSIIGGGPQM